MFSLVLHALRARRAQALAMFALAVLAGLGSAAAPWFLAWGSDAAARSAVDAAPATDRLISGSGTIQVDLSSGSPLDALAALIDEHLPIAGKEVRLGARFLVSLTPVEPDTGPTPPAEQESLDLYLATRVGLCDHLRPIEGVCSTDAGEVMLHPTVASDLGVGVGDTVELAGVRLDDDTTLRVAGIYEIIDPYGPYWVATDLLPTADGPRVRPYPAFASERAIIEAGPRSMDLDLQVLLPPGPFIDPDSQLSEQIREAAVQLSRAGFPASTAEARRLLEQIARDRTLVFSGVAVGVGQLVLVSWVGLFLAVRYTSEERRGDIGLLKLRGATSRRIWTVVGLSSGIPMLAGTLLGAAGGFVAAAGLAYSLDADTGPLGAARAVAIDLRDSLWLSLAAAAIAGLGGLVAALIAELPTTRTPVADLLRKVPAGRRGWRADVVDLVVLVVAGAGVYQGWVESREGGQASLLTLLAPALVGLALALLTARALSPVSARIGSAALRAGRAGPALAALQLARRQGTQRVFAVLAVAAAVFTTMTILWQSSSAAWHQRAVQEVGADRALTVAAPSASALLTAVRSVDPEGRYAMAVASVDAPQFARQVIAIDTTRYATVGRRPAGTATPAQLAPMLRPSAPVPPQVTDGELTVEATGPDLDVPVGLRLYLSAPGGEQHEVDVPLTPGRHAAQSTVDGCAPACRLVALEVLVPPGTTSRGEVTVVVHELRQPGGAVVDGSVLGDITRWRTTLGKATAPPVLASRDGQLSITLPVGRIPPTATIDARALPLVAPAPLPVALAGGQLAARGGEARVHVFGGTEVPATVVSEVSALPSVDGRGVLVDLEYALYSNDSPVETADLAVWLTADAPDSLVAALAEHGVVVLGERSIANRVAELARAGPGLALRFSYFTVAVILLLAAAVALVGSTVDRPGRVAELVALRGQGLSARAMRTAGLAGTAAMVGAAALTGIVGALLAEGLVSAALPAFADEWRLLPTPPGLTPGSLVVSAATIVVVLGVASLVGAGRLVAVAASRTRGTLPARAATRRRRPDVDGPDGRGGSS